MTAKEKDRKWPGRKNHEVFTEVDGTRHIVCSFIFEEHLYGKNYKKGPPIITNLKVLERFVLRTELPNGDVIEY